MVKELCDLYDKLSVIDGVSIAEESYRIHIEGKKLNSELIGLIKEIREYLNQLPDSDPIIKINDEPIYDLEDFKSDFIGSPWALIFSKTYVAERCAVRKDERTVLFFSESGLYKWLLTISPFTKVGTFDPDINKEKTTFIVHGLKKPFGGINIWVLPPSDHSLQKEETLKAYLPTKDDVHTSIHVSSTSDPITISPVSWGVTWGDFSTLSAQELIKLSCLVLSASLASSISDSEDSIKAVVRGQKTFEIPLWSSDSVLKWEKLQTKLIEAVSWTYTERPETRRLLLLDRLTLDLHEGECFLATLNRHLPAALSQARDSYGFVISDRKDEYYKEMREIMKDMKTQADHFATKTREMISFFTRDFLGSLLFLALTLTRQFNLTDTNFDGFNDKSLLLLRALAVYLVLSFLLQLAYQLRDSKLSFSESKQWLKILSNYTKQEEKKNYFLSPIKIRRRTLFVAMIISGLLYSVLAYGLWNLPAALNYGIELIHISNKI